MEKINNCDEELQGLNENNLKINCDKVVVEERKIELEFDERKIKCGFFGYNPKWLQILASKKSFIIIFGILGLYETALGCYYIGTISTIEKRFRFPSALSGVLTSSWDIGTMIASLLVAHFGSTGHKTRWVAFGIFISSISCFLRYLPHLIFGPGEMAIKNLSVNTSIPVEKLCFDYDATVENCEFSSEGSVTFTILIISLFLLGVGTTPYYTLGSAYLDDNILKNKFPFYFSIVICVRFLGPTLGFLLSSYTLSIYVDPESKPSFGEDDPRWIGAWYLGWNPLGFFGIIIAFLMVLFPKILPREAERRKTTQVHGNENKEKTFKDFKQTLYRLAKNPIYMFNTFSSTVGMMGVVGFWIFMPKYMETQFRKTASEANMITGTIGLLSTAVGVVSSGAIISKYRPRPTYLAAWNVFTEIFDIITYFSFAFIGCYKEDLFGNYNEDKTWNLISECNIPCNCSSMITYTPVCSMDKSTTFYSPCHAGCTSWNMINGTTKIYENCTCIDGGFGQATAGPCPIDCEKDFLIFLVLLCLLEFLSATGRAGNTIIQYRAVLPDDKSFSIALTAVVFCALAFIPGPIIYGKLIDISCIVWGVSCGKTGNCWLYNGEKMRYLINFSAAGLLVISTLLDVGVLLNVKNLKIYDDEIEKPEEKDVNKPFLKKFKKINKFMINHN